ncbi:MAG: DUF72 domain-containing protein [Propionicimonas sp.]
MSGGSGSPRAWIGTSGWVYDSWRGVVYPPEVPDAKRLEFYAGNLFDTVELNASHYRWPGDASFRSWRRRLPPGFALTVKAPRALTHAKKLYEPERWIARMAQPLAILEDRLGVVLVQLPPGMSRDDARLDWFLGAVPRSWRVAVEFRHPSWHVEDVFALLERRGAAYVVMSGAGCRASCGRRRGLPTCGCTDRTRATCTAGATTRRRCRGGRIGRGSGWPRGEMSTRTSTTMGTATRSATPSRCAATSAEQPGLPHAP